MEMNSKIAAIAGRAICVRGNDIDTDRIIPARYLRAVTFEGLGPHVFEDDRKAAGGAHPFDNPKHQGAAILLVNRNFGSGSSREHAPQGLMRWGIRALIGESFAEIFSGNCAILGVPCVVLPGEAVAALQTGVERDPSSQVTIDLEARRVMTNSGSWPIQMPESVRQAFVSGRWDTLAELLSNEQSVRAVAQKLPYMKGFDLR